MRYTYLKDKDTRDNSDIFVLKILESLSKDEFKKYSFELKKVGGYYSNFKKGFIFKENKDSEIKKVLGVSDKDFDIEEIKKISIVSFCEQNGIALKGNRKWYSLIEHDSLVVNAENNTFIWNSRGLSGDIINFVTAYYDVEFKKAIELIIGESSSIERYESHSGNQELERERNTERLTDELNESKNMKNVFAYLIKTRGISKDIVQEFVDQKLIKQDKNNNIIFKTFDDSGNLIAVSRKGTGGAFFQRIEPDSENVGFRFKVGDTVNQVYFFESPIDLMSYYELNKEKLANVELIAMGGLKYSIIESYLEKQGSSSVVLAVDNDKAGEKFIETVQVADVNVTIEKPMLKDWNEDLIQKKNDQQIEESQEILKKLEESAKKIVVSKESLREFTIFASKFYKYSPNNQMLIHMQNRYAQFVASETYFRNEHKLEIAPNQKPLEIIAPMVKKFYKDENGEIKNLKSADEATLEKIENGILSKFEKVTGYTRANVYDITQTTAPKEKYPEILRAEKIEVVNSNIDYEKTYHNLRKNIESQGIQIEYKELSNPELGLGIKGYTDQIKIVINKDESIESKICVLMHEYAHVMLHKDDGDTATYIKEIEAESVAFAAANKLGLDNIVSSAKYIQSYKKDIPEEEFKKLFEKNPSGELNRILKNISKGIRETNSIIQEAIVERKVEQEICQKMSL